MTFVPNTIQLSKDLARDFLEGREDDGAFKQYLHQALYGEPMMPLSEMPEEVRDWLKAELQGRVGEQSLWFQEDADRIWTKANEDFDLLVKAVELTVDWTDGILRTKKEPVTRPLKALLSILKNHTPASVEEQYAQLQEKKMSPLARAQASLRETRYADSTPVPAGVGAGSKDGGELSELDRGDLEGDGAISPGETE